MVPPGEVTFWRSVGRRELASRQKLARADHHGAGEPPGDVGRQAGGGARLGEALDEVEDIGRAGARDRRHGVDQVLARRAIRRCRRRRGAPARRRAGRRSPRGSRRRRWRRGARSRAGSAWRARSRARSGCGRADRRWSCRRGSRRGACPGRRAASTASARPPASVCGLIASTSDVGPGDARSAGLSADAAGAARASASRGEGAGSITATAAGSSPTASQPSSIAPPILPAPTRTREDGRSDADDVMP